MRYSESYRPLLVSPLRRQRNERRMKRIVVILSIITFLIMVYGLSGCSHVSWKYGGAEFSRYSFGTDTTVSDIDIFIDSNGSKHAVVKGLNTDQTSSIRAAAEGAAKGAVKGAIP